MSDSNISKPFLTNLPCLCPEKADITLFVTVLNWQAQMVCLPTCFHWTRNATRGSTRGAATMNPGPVRPCGCLYVTIVKSRVLALVSSAFKLSQLATPKVSMYMRTWIELLQKEGLHPAGIFKVLKREGSSVSFPSVARIVKKLQTTGSLANLPRSGRPSKLSTEAKAFIDQQVRKNDEMRVARYKRTWKSVALQWVIFCHMIINSSDREEACTKFTTAEYYFDVRALVLSG